MSGREQARVSLRHSEGQECLEVSGCLGFATVTALAKEAEPLFQGRARLLVDLAGVERVDSAGLALLVEWTRRARALDQTIEFVNMPDQLLKIAGVSGLQGVLPFRCSEAH